MVNIITLTKTGYSKKYEIKIAAITPWRRQTTNDYVFLYLVFQICLCIYKTGFPYLCIVNIYY
jgi:hypothetical protein